MAKVDYSFYESDENFEIGNLLESGSTSNRDEVLRYKIDPYSYPVEST